jgi:DNA polymerase-3 subunit epsilon
MTEETEQEILPLDKELADLLQLERPLVFFDLEATGVQPKRDRIVQLVVVKVYPDGRRDLRNRLINPEMPIPPESTEIHGITDDMVANEATFRRISKSLYRFLDGCDLAGYNIARFDVPMLIYEFDRVGLEFDVGDRKLVDAQRIFFQREPRTLEAALKFYCQADLVNAHDAAADVDATMQVLAGQFRHYGDLPNTVVELEKEYGGRDESFVDWEGRLRWKGSEVVIGFGQKMNMTLRELARREPDYLNWILRGDFNREVKAIVRDALRGQFPKKEQD